MTLTREEAIERLKQNKAAAEYYAGQSQITAEIENALKDSEAFDMAIEALNREQQIIENGYTGKEMRIRIGGRLFAVRELAQ